MKENDRETLFTMLFVIVIELVVLNLMVVSALVRFP